jgi:hypothetical protein
MTIIRPSRGETFEADLIAGERRSLWVTIRNAQEGRYTLRAVFAVGWRIIATSAAERALLEEHGFEVCP